jgi:hypothetical protein
MFATTLALAAVLSANPAAASGDLLPDEELPTLKGAEPLCDVIIWIAETFGPNIPTEVNDSAPAPEALDGVGLIEFTVATQEGVDVRAAHRWFADHDRLAFQLVERGSADGVGHVTWALDLHDACEADVAGACDAAEGYDYGEARLFVEMNTEAMVTYGMAFEKIIVTYDDGAE